MFIQPKNNVCDMSSSLEAQAMTIFLPTRQEGIPVSASGVFAASSMPPRISYCIRCSRRYRLAQVFGQTFHQLHHRSGCDGGILQAPLLSDLGERSSCMTAQSCAAPGSDRMSLQDIAQALDPRAHLTTYQTQSGGEHRGKALAPSI